jgi:alkanesulfonate monooxygenase SsuD/methylene tetrahydromethanopterin reductase-like flavin-dependent oxidoreductase (luciferase family)
MQDTSGPAEDRRRLQIGVKPAQWDVDWPTLQATWELADELPELDSAWLFDHFVAVKDRVPAPQGAHEAMTTAAALAACTRRLRFGHLVLGNTYRHPALVARMATTVDHIAGPRRFVLGLGAGWLEEEHRMFAWPYPSLGERVSMLESAVRVIKEMWRHPDGASITASPYELEAARTDPPPLTSGGPPVWLGVQGVRGIGIAARHADGWNWSGSVDQFVERRDQLMRACEGVGRDPAEIEISAQISCFGRHAAEVLESAEAFVRSGVNHVIFAILTSDGPAGLRRLRDEVVAPLRERYP